MKKIYGGVLLCVCAVLVLGIASLALADSAAVLPKGVSRLNVKYSFYSAIDERFGPDDDEESLSTDFNAVLDDTIFPLLLPPGTNVGTSVVDFEYDFADLILEYFYGLSDKVTLGVYVPYYWNKTDLKEARVDTSGATQAVLDSLLGAGFPAGDPATDAAVTSFVLAALEGPPFQFKPFDTVEESGLSDIEVIARYQYYKDDRWQLSFTGGVRFPTGDVDDPDNLLDTEFGSGAYALLFRFNQDYTGVENLTLNATVGYDLVLPDEETVRVLDDVNQPLAPIANKEKVERDLGDVFKVVLSGDLSLSKTLSIGLLYEYAEKQKDDVDGDLGLAYESLEDETDWTSNRIMANVTYSTVQRYLDEETAIPFDLYLEYEDYFAGSNNFLKQKVLSLGVTAYF